MTDSGQAACARRLRQRQLGERLQRFLLPRRDQQRAHRGGLPCLQPLLDARPRPDQRDVVHQRIGHRRHCLGLLAGKVQVLDLHRRVFVAQAPGVVVVEILAARAHAADVQREVLLHRLAALRHVVAEDAGDKGRDVEIREALAAAGLGEAGLQVRLQELEALRVHPYRDQAVGDFRAAGDARRADGRGVDLHVLAAVQDALQRLAQAGGAGPAVGNLVVLALEFQRRLAREDLPHDGDVLARARERLAVGNAVPALHHLRARGAEAEDEAPARERIQRHRRHRGRRRRARGHLHDRGAEADPGRERGDVGKRRHRIRAVGLGAPHRVEAEALGLEDQFAVYRQHAA